MLRTKAFFISNHLRRIYLNAGDLFHRLYCYPLYECSRPALVVVFLYGGNIPFVVSLCFASQRTPTVCAYCAGSISTIGLRSFLLKVSGVSSHLSFCCTSLVSGFIIHADASFVHSQTIQRNRQIFVETLKTTGKIQQKWSADRRFCALRPTLDSSCEKPLLQLLAAGPIACGVFQRNA